VDVVCAIIGALFMAISVAIYYEGNKKLHDADSAADRVMKKPHKEKARKPLVIFCGLILDSFTYCLIYGRTMTIKGNTVTLMDSLPF